MSKLVVTKTFGSVGFGFLEPFVLAHNGRASSAFGCLATLHAYGISTGAPQDTKFKVQGINQKFIESILTKINHLTKISAGSSYNNECEHSDLGRIPIVNNRFFAQNFSEHLKRTIKSQDINLPLLKKEKDANNPI